MAVEPLSFLAPTQLDPGLVDACGSEPNTLCEFVYDQTGSTTTAEIVDWVVERPLKIALILLLAFVANLMLRRLIDRGVARMVADREAKLAQREQNEVEDGRFDAFQDKARRKTEYLLQRSERSQQRAHTLGSVGKSVVAFALWGLAFLLILGEFDVNLGPLVAGAGVVGIALGFGAQSLVRDFLSGVFMIIEDQYGVGDVVDVGDATGVVEAVSLRTTRLRDVNGTVWFFPNGEIRRVGNKSQQWARSVLDIGVAYGTDLEQAIAIIKEVADSVWHAQLENATVLEEPEVWGVEAFADSSILIRVVLKTEPSEQFATARAVRRRIKEAFEAAGIEIPFPQRDIRVHQVGPAS